VAEGVGPEVKPQHHKKTNKQKHDSELSETFVHAVFVFMQVIRKI
jgi:hypothetical protein